MIPANASFYIVKVMQEVLLQVKSLPLLYKVVGTAVFSSIFMKNIKETW